MSERHWSDEALVARIDVAWALNGNRGPASPERAQLRLDLLNIVSAVDFQTMKSDAALPKLLELLAKAEEAE
ncbi:hypothetical protein [Herbiconiux liukaitaii]|uniref:hypothetical protein n=1 Tax=Herbiconiux liukaitaii TaxID=3342799 RepID=UPI0035BB45FB